MIDFTQGNPARAILRFSLPMLVGNVFQQFYNMVDLMVVGRFVGWDALASVGAASSSMFFILSLCIGLTNGIAVVVAQYLGARNTEKVQHAIGMSVYLLAGSGLLLSVGGYFLSAPLLRLLQTPGDVIGGSIDYLQIICLGILATVLYNGVANILRAFGDSRTPLLFLIVAVVLNIGLDLLFVIQFRMGVAGVAWATILAQAISAAASIVYCVRRMPLMRLEQRHLVPDRALILQSVKMGVPSALQNSVLSLTMMAVQSVVNSFGSVVVAGYSAAIKLDQLASQPLMTLGMTTANYTAQNVGAGDYARVRKGFRAVCVMAAAFGLFMAAVFNLFGRGLLSMFVEAGDGASVLDAGFGYLRVVSLFYVMLGVGMCVHNLLRGAGDVMMPMICGIVEAPIRYVAALLLSARLGPLGIWLATPVGWGVNLLIAIPRYLGRAWQKKALVHTPLPDDMPPEEPSGSAPSVPENDPNKEEPL